MQGLNWLPCTVLFAMICMNKCFVNRVNTRAFWKEFKRKKTQTLAFGAAHSRAFWSWHNSNQTSKQLQAKHLFVMFTWSAKNCFSRLCVGRIPLLFCVRRKSTAIAAALFSNSKQCWPLPKQETPLRIGQLSQGVVKNPSHVEAFFKSLNEAYSDSTPTNPTLIFLSHPKPLPFWSVFSMFLVSPPSQPSHHRSWHGCVVTSICR